MASKPKHNQPQTPDEPQGRDLFQTPAYAVDLLVPFIPESVREIWEPAAGEGRLARRLEHHGYSVTTSDIRGSSRRLNFLDDDDSIILAPELYDAVITNPPFSLKRFFYVQCLWLGRPFALLIPADYSGWVINAVSFHGCEKIVPTRRIDYITPNGNSGKSSSAQFHSMWLTHGFGIGRSESFVELSLRDKENI